jgi:hypothetical protein
VDVNRFQFFLPEDPAGHLDRLTFDGTPKLPGWEPPGVYVYKPKLKRGNFLSFMGGGALICDARAVEELREMLEMSGELLPLPHKGELFQTLNVTECVNVLDEEKTDWVIGQTTRQRIGIKRYAFHPERLPETPLFKIPETARAEILTTEARIDPEDEFKPAVERLGLTGLLFEELWRSN